MSPITHLLLSWAAAETAPLSRRERFCVALAGVAPDLDGLGVVVDVLRPGRDLYQHYHHVLLHNLAAGAVAAGVAAALARPGWRVVVAAMAGATWLLHLLCDVLGSRGPDGYQWPLQPLLPVHTWEWTWPGQWALDAWPNLAITLLAIVAVVLLGLRRGRTPLELLSRRADAAVVGAIRRRMTGSGLDILPPSNESRMTDGRSAGSRRDR